MNSIALESSSEMHFVRRRSSLHIY